MSNPITKFDSLGFATSFTCRPVEWPPDTSTAIQFAVCPRLNPEATGDALLEVSPRNAPAWIGWFEPDDPYFPSGAYACPSGWELLVVSEGNGYLVPVESPTNYGTLVGPIHGVARVPGRLMIVIWTEQDLIAYDEFGEKWWIDHLAHDGLEISDISPDTIRGSVTNLVTGKPCDVAVDVRTGSVTGGWPDIASVGGAYPRLHSRST